MVSTSSTPSHYSECEESPGFICSNRCHCVTLGGHNHSAKEGCGLFWDNFPHYRLPGAKSVGTGPGPGHSASTLTVNTRPGGNPAFDKLKVEFGSLTSEGRHRFEEVESGPLHLQPSDEEKGLFGKVTPAQVRLNYDQLAFLGVVQRQCTAERRSFVLVRSCL